MRADAERWEKGQRGLARELDSTGRSRGGHAVARTARLRNLSGNCEQRQGVRAARRAGSWAPRLTRTGHARRVAQNPEYRRAHIVANTPKGIQNDPDTRYPMLAPSASWRHRNRRRRGGLQIGDRASNERDAGSARVRQDHFGSRTAGRGDMRGRRRLSAAVTFPGPGREALVKFR
jgi:hypothetical protein